MKILDDQQTIKQYYKSQVAQTISFLPAQIEQSWTEASKLKLPKNYKNFQNIVISGMGGSNLATEMIRDLYGRDLKIPFILVRHYHLPQFVNQNSLVIISSYSGQTEETLSCFKEALAKKAKILCLSGGGRLKTLAHKHKIPHYQIAKKYNPAGQPRYGLGLQLGATLAFLKKTKLIKVADQEIKQATQYLSILNKTFQPEIDSTNNFAKKLAEELQNHLPILVAADFLSANTHILANQINESAKNIIQYYAIPELNHHLLEGLQMPQALTSKIKFIFFNSNLYEDIIRRRFYITEKILKKQKIKFIDYAIASESRLLTSLEILLLGSWVSYYLTILNKQDPTAIPWVNFLKKELAK